MAVDADRSSRIAQLLDAFEGSLPFALDSFQREAIEKLETTRGVLVSAPTSSGKTVVAEYAVWRALEAPQHLRPGITEAHHVIYTTPLKALSNQKYHDLCDRYGAENIGLVTGEHTINDPAPVLVMTTEVLRNVLYDDPARVDRVGIVVLDEVHYIDDYPRGTVWEEIIIEAPRHVRLIGLSATISNVDEVADWMSGLRGEVATVVRTDRPVALELWLAVDNRLEPLFDEKGHVHRRTWELGQTDALHDARFRYARRAPENDLLHIIEELRRRAMLPAIYFIFSRRGCAEALGRCAVHGVDLTSDSEKPEILRRFDAAAEAIADEDERRLFVAVLDRTQISRGVAMHHAGMLPSAKELVERLFITGLIKVVFATETLSLGLNMPARACVVSSFTKFDGTGFHPLTSGELTQLMGRAGRRGIDTLGHGVILKEHDIDLRDIYDAAVGGEMAVESKFSPTYTMTLSLLRTRDVTAAEALLEKSFGQYQNLQRTSNWSHRKHNLEDQLSDLRRRVFRHPRVKCTEKTLSTHLAAATQIDDLRTEIRRAKRDFWRDSRRGRYGAGRGQPGGHLEQMRRRVNSLEKRLDSSPCRGCPHFSDHRAHRQETQSLQELLSGGEAELETNRQRYRREFRAYRAVLHDAGFLVDDSPTDLGTLAASLYGENALLVADAIAAGVFDGLEPAELAAALVMLVAEDRGRDRPASARRHFPSERIAVAHRHLRSTLQRFVALESVRGLATLRPLSYDFIAAAHQWCSGVAIMEIDIPTGADIGDVVKAMKNLYSMLRQMELSLRRHPLHPLVAKTRETMERDLIRRF